MLSPNLKLALVAIGVLGVTTVSAQTPPLKTSDIAIDAAGICWKGSANALIQVAPILKTPVAITSATQVLTKGVWLVVSTTATATVVISDGTAVTGIATGNAYPV